MLSRVHKGTWTSGVQVLWRDLTWGEFQKVRYHPGPHRLLHAYIFDQVYVGGFPKDRVPAGIVHYIGRQQIDQNPFSGQHTSISRELEEKRQSLTYLDMASAVIASTFNIPFGEIETWSPELFFRRLAQSERVLNRHVRPADPNAPKQEQQPQRRRRQPQPSNLSQE